MAESEMEAKLRLKDCHIADLEYEIRQLRGSFPKRPWRWVKKYERGSGDMHWCLESIDEPDNGVGDGVDRTVGLVLIDCWSKEPTPLMLFVQRALNGDQDNQKRKAPSDTSGR